MDSAVSQIIGLQNLVSNYSRHKNKAKYIYARKVLKLYNYVICKIRDEEILEMVFDVNTFLDNEKILLYLEMILSGFGFSVFINKTFDENDEMLIRYIIKMN